MEDFTLSLGSVHRHRQTNRRETAQMVFDEYKQPKFPIIHWDSKLFKGIGNIPEDRVAIYTSFPSKLLGINYTLSFFLLFCKDNFKIGIPKIFRSTGEQQKEAVLQALE